MEFKSKTTFNSQGKYWTIVEAREATNEEILEFKLNELMKREKEDLAMQILLYEAGEEK